MRIAEATVASGGRDAQPLMSRPISIAAGEKIVFILCIQGQKPGLVLSKR